MSGVWTRNYSNAMANWLGGGRTQPASSSASYNNNNLSVKNFSGNLSAASYILVYIDTLPNLYDVAYGHTSIGCGIEFGTGTTAPTFDDYRVQSPLSSFTVSQKNINVNTLNWDGDTKQYSTTRRFVVQYTGSSEITIREFGIYARSGYDGSNVLIYREVFDTPITVNQYESVVIELTQAFPIINYEPYPA